MGMMTEFKEFAMRGNVIDLAVGVVIGAAFGKIVTALVDKVIMPPLGLLIGGVDFSKMAIVLKDATVDAAGKDVPRRRIGIWRVHQCTGPVRDRGLRHIPRGQGDQPHAQEARGSPRPRPRKTCCCCARSAIR
jgi:hypothetical protein